jgi:adenosyl cobinamide kinase/adenosyl cobinamide phosphate guanylyltransferase
MASSAPPRQPGPALTLVLGGARSGKSALAERLVLGSAGGGRVHYVATTVVDPGDGDLAARVAGHRARRGERWITTDAGDDLAGTVSALPAEPALIDALGPWLASPAVTPTWAGTTAAFTTPGGPLDRLVAALVERAAPTVVVSDEAGMGVHPETAVGRRWRDALGLANQAVAAVAGDVWLVVAGRVLPLARADDAGGVAPCGLHHATDGASHDATHEDS